MLLLCDLIDTMIDNDRYYLAIHIEDINIYKYLRRVLTLLIDCTKIALLRGDTVMNTELLKRLEKQYAICSQKNDREGMELYAKAIANHKAKGL